MSTVSSNLYPPIMPDTLPAFVGDNCRIYFSLSKYNSASDIKNIQVSLMKQKTNTSILKSPSGILIINGSPTVINENESSDYKYYITINKNQIINNSFDTNEYYKIQLRFTAFGAEDISQNTEDQTATEATSLWLEKNKNYFSEWSKTCLIKCIASPKLTLKHFEQMNNTNQEIILTNQMVDITGALENLDSGEYLRSYNIKLYSLNDENKVIIDSGDIFTNEYKPNEFNYQLPEELLDGVSYKLIFSYTTNNGYSQTYEYIFRTVQRGLAQLNGVITATPDNENGKIIVSIGLNDSGQYLKNVTIRRTSSKSNFHKWEDIMTIPASNNTNIFIWQDNTVQSGIFYKYCFQQRNARGDRGIIKDKNITNPPVMVLFEDMFLITKDAQLKIKFDPNVSDFKYNVTESQQVAIGAKYPYIKRNSNNYFRTFSIGGLITSLVDNDYYNSYFEQNNNSYTYHTNDHINLITNNNLNKFTSKQQIYQETTSEYQKYNTTNNISEYQDFVYEKEFRQKVYDFLYKHNVKLFKSTTEGNILVKLMNISFQPVASLGRMLYSFTASAVQVDEATISNYDKYDIIKIGQYSQNMANYLTFLGQLQGTFNGGQNLIDTVLKEKYYNRSKYGYINEISNLTSVKIEITSPPYAIVDNGSLVKLSTINGNVSTSKIASGYIIIINGKEILIPAFQRMIKKQLNNGIITTIPERVGYFELNNEDIVVTNLQFKYPVEATIDYVASVIEKEDTSKIPNKTVYYYNPGQIYGSFEPGELLIKQLTKKYFLNNKKYFQKLISIDGVRLEGPQGAVVYIKDSRDTEYTRHVLHNGYLQLMQDDIFINELYFNGIHLTTEIDKNSWYKKSNLFPVQPFDESDENVYIGFPENPQSNKIYKIRRTKEVNAVLYNEWFDDDNKTLKMESNDAKKSYQLKNNILSLYLDPTDITIDEDPIEMINIYSSWYSLEYYNNNKNKFIQLLDSDIRYIRNNEYIIIGEASSLNDIKNPKNHEVYIVQGYRWIYHNNQWYPFSDNNDIICPVDGIVDYFYELTKGEYLNEI